MHKTRSARKLLASPVILPMLNVVLIVQFFYILNVSFWRSPAAPIIHTPANTLTYYCGAYQVDWEISLDKNAQWWIESSEVQPQKIEPKALVDFIDQHPHDRLMLQIDENTPYDVMASLFEHLSPPHRYQGISFKTK
ncbi:MAG: biopolymer transporter ExbD, partial [Bacteroidota bacterium]